MLRESLTAARLAEIVGVQPSAISHILSGRNYPRFDFLHSLLNAYPKMNARWLLLGEGDIYIQPNSQQKLPAPQKVEIDCFEPQNELLQSKDIPTPITKSPTTPTNYKNHNSKKKTIEKIIIFYDDGTFSMYENK